MKEVTEQQLQEWRNEIEAEIKADTLLEGEAHFRTDWLGYRWLEVQYRYPGRGMTFEKIGCHYDNEFGYAERCKNDILENIRKYKAGETETGIIAVISNEPCDKDTWGDGNNPYMWRWWQ